jgi:hypothetical protein
MKSRYSPADAAEPNEAMAHTGGAVPPGEPVPAHPPGGQPAGEAARPPEHDAPPIQWRVIRRLGRRYLGTFAGLVLWDRDKG